MVAGERLPEVGKVQYFPEDFAEETTPLIDYEDKLGTEARLAAPTPDHYLPLLYVIGTRSPSEPVTFPVEGVDGGSISMLAEQVG
jgi:4,5-DOPA dioxygenase extradiol